MYKIEDFKIGETVWWFNSINTLYSHGIKPCDIDLVHDIIKEIKNNELICFHKNIPLEMVWGKTRKEAWNRLKQHIEKWGNVDES